jgi:hypothetical protein
MPNGKRVDISNRFTVLVIKPSAPDCWTVYIDGRKEGHWFASRSQILSYGRMCASANPPSILVLFNERGKVDKHWSFATPVCAPAG